MILLAAAVIICIHYDDFIESRSMEPDGMSGRNQNRTAEQIRVYTALQQTMKQKEGEIMQKADTGLTESGFYYEPLSGEIKERITGISYPDTTEPIAVSYEDLVYMHVLHYDFDHQIAEGELICNQTIAEDLLEIFQELFENEYPIEKICLVDEYGGDDEASMADNNTSCFNYRTISGTTNISNHSYGLAVDINPLYNPYVTYRPDGSAHIQPENGSAYVEREAEFSHKIDQKDLCYRLFTEHGFTWGGDWKNSKDYQHFEKR